MKESSVTTVELGSAKKKSTKENPKSSSKRVNSLPKVNLKRKVVKKPLSVQDLELKADSTILE